jgi:tRNA/rRNA methyltransferase
MNGPEKTSETPGGGPVIILVRPQMAENIGMAARAMANFGLAEMRLVAPRDGWPQKTRMKKGAHQAASGATHILEEAKLFDTVAEAAGDLAYLIATTARERGQSKPVYAPDEAMKRIVAVPGGAGRVGILFGPERTGLDSDEVSLADAILTFPINPAFASLNLAQAVLLVAYEWFKADKGGGTPFAAPENAPARRETLFSFMDHIENELTRVNFFWPPDRKPVMARNFRNILHRLALTEQDVRTLRGAMDALTTGGKPKRLVQRSPTAHDPESGSGA